MTARIILASASPRRQQLLDQVGVAYKAVSADVDESIEAGERAADYVVRIAASKAHWVAARETGKLPVLAADTAVVLRGNILGKPVDAQEARRMLASLSGQVHEVFSAVVLLTPGGDELRRTGVSTVTFAPIEAAWIEAYCATGEPLDKAGAYAIQGYAAQHISRLEGSYSGVMGLPLFETMDLLRCAGIHILPGLNQDCTK
jgi:septum formation protein